METHPAPRILTAEKLDNSVLIGFDDGRWALYSATLLDATFSQALQVPDDDLEEEE